jgi:hypothetical protein
VAALASELEKTLGEVLARGVTPVLSPAGFKKSGLYYRWKKESLTWLVSVQKSRWNDASKSEFTLNGGVFVVGTVSKYSRRPEPQTPTLADCILSVRIGMFDRPPLDKWWRLTESDPADQISAIADDLCNRLRLELLPFLGLFKTREAVAGHLTQRQPLSSVPYSPQAVPLRLVYAALIHKGLGQNSLAQEVFSTAVSNARGTPIEEFVTRLGPQIQNNSD